MFSMQSVMRYSLLVALLLGLRAGQSALAQDTTANSSIYLPMIVQQTAGASTDNDVLRPSEATAAAVNTLMIVRLTPDTEIQQFSLDYQASVVDKIESLDLYRLYSNTGVPTTIGTDPRVLWIEPDNSIVAFEARHTNDYDALQRFFGSDSGNGDDGNEQNNAKKKGKKKTDPGKPKELEYVLIVDSAVVVDQKWRTWGIRESKIEKVHKYAQGTGIVVAIVDTGIDLDHPDLVARLQPGYDFVDSDPIPDDLPNGVDEDEDGAVDEATGHGTHVAGIVAMVAPKARILPVRVLNSDGGGMLFDIVEGIVYAVDSGAKVINLSMSAEEDSPVFEAAIQYALAHDVLVVAATAGTKDYLEYPAAYEGVIAVGALKNREHIADFSLDASRMTDLFAPGEIIFSTYYGGRYAWWSGSSMAAPFVSGAAALMLEVAPCSSACVNSALTTEVGNIKPKINGRGRLEMEKVFKLVKKLLD